MLMAPDWQRNRAVAKEEQPESRWLLATRAKLRKSDALAPARMPSRRGMALAAAAGGIDRPWYVLRVMGGAEKDVDRLLEYERVEHWLPLVKLPQKARSGRAGGCPAAKEVLAWPGYIFIRMPNAAVCWAGLATVDRILAVLGTAERPAPIADEDVRRYRLLLEHDEAVRKEIADEMTAGQKVRVVDGPFSSFPGMVKAVAGERLTVEVAIFGRMVPVELELAQVAKLR